MNGFYFVDVGNKFRENFNKVIKKLTAILLNVWSISANAQYEKYYSDGYVSSGDGTFSLWVVGLIIVGVFFVGNKEVKIGILKFLALFGFPLGFGLLGKLAGGFFGAFMGGFLGLFLGYKFLDWLDKFD